VLAHGFTQTGRLWGPFGASLGTRHELVAVDLPGHGGSANVRCDLAQGGRALVEAGGDGVFDLLGYSLGARFALHAALACPERIGRLVLVGGTPGVQDPDTRAERRRRDDLMASELEESGDLEGFLRRWVASPMFTRVADPEMGERLRNTPAGLASSLRLAGAGVQEPLWDRLGLLRVPTLLVAGAADVRFGAIGARMARAMPDAMLTLLPGAGHAAHLEQPALASKAVLGFLADRGPRAT
jgi:2-succinyl-6-hydroxy-2,4-cyclohexadiene-1-carboxylate synthase